jgi:hypothetical protein
MDSPNLNLFDLETHRLPLSPAQFGVYVEHLRDAKGCVFNIGQLTQIETPIDIERFRQAARCVIARTAALNMAILADTEGPFQQFTNRRDTQIPYQDLRSAANPDRERHALIQAMLTQPFDLAHEPLFRWILLQVCDARIEWVQVYHHVAIDGISVHLIAADVAKTYSQGESCCDQATCLNDYRAFLAQEHAYQTGKHFKQDRDYWLSLLHGVDPAEPFESLSSAKTHSHFVRQHVILGGTELQELNASSRRLAVSPGQFLLAAAILLEAQDSGRDDIVLAIPLLGRMGPTARTRAGMASNLGHLRMAQLWNHSLASLMAEIARQHRHSLRHQRYRLEDIRRELFPQNPTTTLARVSLNLMPFDYSLVFDTSASITQNLSNGPVDGISIAVYQATNNELPLDLDGNAAFFDQTRLNDYAERFLWIVQSLTQASAQTPVASLMLTPKRDIERLGAFNASSLTLNSHLPPDLPLLPTLFARAAAAHPQAIALVCGEAQLSYAELDPPGGGYPRGDEERRGLSAAGPRASPRAAAPDARR